jgi:putative ABC transport system permease protein
MRPALPARTFRAFLRLLPFDFRAEFGDEMQAAFEEQHRDARSRGARQRGVFWRRNLADTLRTAVAQHWDLLRHDVRFGARMLARNPGFTLVALLTLTLGVGATTAVYTVVYGVILKPLPFPDPYRLISITSPLAGSERADAVSFTQIKEAARQCDAFDGVAAYLRDGPFRLGSGTERAAGISASPALLRILGARIALGRSLNDSDAQAGARRVAVISDRLWLRYFGASRDVLGSPLWLAGDDTESFGVVGVLAPGLEFPYPRWTTDVDVWTPLNSSRGGWEEQNRLAFTFMALGRLRAAVSLGQARVQLDTLSRRLAAEDAEGFYAKRRLHAVRWRDQIAGAARVPLLVSLGAVGFLLLVACANVANLLLARGAARRREFAIRSALGAGRLRLARQMLTENLALALAGGLAGLFAARWMVEGFLALKPDYLPRLADIAIDYRVASFACATTALSACAFSLIPILQATRSRVVDALARAAGSPGVTSRAQRSLSAIAIAELAITLVLLVAGGLLARNFVGLLRSDLGFDPISVVALDLRQVETGATTASTSADRRLTQADYRNAVAVLNNRLRRQAAANEEIEQRARSLPGVIGAGVTTRLPLGGQSGSTNIRVEGWPERGPGVPMADIRSVSAGYFRALGMRLKAGRWFTERDREGAARVAIINEACAATFWPGTDPVRRTVGVGLSPVEIVGIVGDTRHSGPERPAAPEVYLPDLQRPMPWTTLVVKTAGRQAGLEAAVTRELRTMGGDREAARVRALEDLLWDVVALPRLAAVVFAGFSVLALVLAVVGVHGVLRYSVAQRVHEIGIRMSLGASSRQVTTLVLRQALTWAALGLALGVGGALAAGRLMRTLLYGITPTDAPTWIGVSTVFLAAVVAAAWGPARRATRVDPVECLRAE